MLTVHRTIEKFPCFCSSACLSLSIQSISQSVSLSVCLPVPHHPRQGTSLCDGGARTSKRFPCLSVCLSLSVHPINQSVNQSVCLFACALPGETRTNSVSRWCLPSTEQAEGFPVSVRLPVSLSVRSISLSVCLPVPQRARQGTSLCRCGAYRPQNKRRVSPLCEGVGAS